MSRRAVSTAWTLNSSPWMFTDGWASFIYPEMTNSSGSFLRNNMHLTSAIKLSINIFSLFCCDLTSLDATYITAD